VRLRLAVSVSALAALSAIAVSGVAGAAPRHNNGLTINATPNPIDAGDAVMIYGQLNNQPIGNQTIVLYHRLAGHRQFTEVGTTSTDSTGFYKFTRAENVVYTNRAWFVREAGKPSVHSRTIHEYVRALVSMTPSTTSTDTSTPVTFTGSVIPNHARDTVKLQEQNDANGDWYTLKTGKLNSSSAYSITYRWVRPGDHDVRVLFPGDARNIAGASDGATIAVQQAQNPEFTITSSQPIISEGSQVTISGVLYMPGSTTTPDPGVSVTLWAKGPDQKKFHSIGVPVLTGNDGSYSFTEMPVSNTVYQVRTTFKPHRSTALLYEGVRDVVQMSSSSTTSTVGGQVTFSGSVSPDKAGHRIYLQRLGADNEWHSVEVTRVRHDSTFEFHWTFVKTGSPQFRARIFSDEFNVGAASSPPVTITVS